MRALFWLLIGTVVYTYLGYPALLWLTARAGGRRPRSAPVDPASLPRVSILLCVHNEAGWLARRLENLLALRYPRDHMEIVVGSDGSTDATASVARSFEKEGVRLLEAGERRGKTSLLNDLITIASGEVVVFTDANARFGEDALRYLVEPFASTGVGCVVGELVYVNGETAVVRAGEGLYWRFENAIKEMEGSFGKTVVATGAIYAMRRSLCRPLPSAVSDDSLNPLLVLAAGYDVIVEPRAQAFENAATSLREEFHRKARMVTRQLGAHRRVGFFLKPLRLGLAVRLVSHKLLRWLAPVLLLAALLVDLALLDGWIYRLAAAGGIAGLVAFALGAVAIALGYRVPAALRLWVYFCLVNVAAMKGIADFLRGRQRAIWTASPSTR